MSTHAIDRMGTPVGLFGATRSSPSAGRKARRRLWGPVAGSVAVHVALIAGAWTIEIPARAAAAKDEPIEVSLLAGPGPAAGAPDLPPGPPEAPPAAPVRRAAPPAPRPQAPKVLAVAPPVEERPAPREELVAEAPSQEEAAPAEETEAEALPEERSLLDGALADASGALHGQRGGGGGAGLGGGMGGGGSQQGGGSAFGNALVDGSKVAVSPLPLEKVEPDYPRMARRRGVEGRVLLRVVVDKEGRVEPDQIQVLESVPGLDAASVAAVKQWRFTPGRDRTGAPLRVFIRVPFRFTLQ